MDFMEWCLEAVPSKYNSSDLFETIAANEHSVPVVHVVPSAVDLDDQGKKLNKCSKCQGLGHNSRSCGLPKKPVEKKREYTCQFCNKAGHKSSKCLENPNRIVTVKYACKICKVIGHTKAKCPDRDR